jgi:hypothetical protein
VFGGNLVAIVVVLFFVFLTMGALVSVVQELVAQLVRARSRSLRRCIRSMLQDDTYQDRIFNRVYRHPRIATAGKKVRSLTYINENDFAIAMATAIQPNNSGDDDAICALPDSILALQEGKLKQRLRLAMPDVFRADRNPDQIKAAVASWYNAQMNTQELKGHCALDEGSSELLKLAMNKLQLSARAYERILKVARTIADLDGKEKIESAHLSEAIQYRSLDRENWGG